MRTNSEYQGNVYLMRPVYGRNCPKIDFESHGYWEEWEELERPFPPGVDTQHSTGISFAIDHPDATSWDWYYGANDGVFSSKACDALWPWMSACCNRFAVALNGETYYIVDDNGVRIDCLDTAKSVFEMYESAPRIKEAERLRFIRSRIQDSLIFRLPQYNSLLATDGIRQRASDAGLRGFEFVNCESLSGCL